MSDDVLLKQTKLCVYVDNSDSVPHVPDAYIDMAKVFTLMKNVTDLLRDTFPGIPIFPTIGNHDVWPAHQIPGAANAYYSQVLQLANFNQLLGKSETESFKQGWVIKFMN